MPRQFLQSERIAYFSMEIALQSSVPTYAGGLGILAGDALRSAADLSVPMVGVSLVSRDGYFRQTLDAAGVQSEAPDSWDPKRFATPLAARVAVPMDGCEVWIGGFLYVIESQLGGRQPVVLLDTELADNAPQHRAITRTLYGGDMAYRLRQEIVLGIGGARMLHALGFHVREYHMNEGHSALLALELLQRHAYPEQDVQPGESRYDLPLVRSLCNFTTHTPVEAGHDQFPYPLLQQVLGDFIELPLLKQLGGSERLNLTRLALNTSEYVNGVAKRHAQTSEGMFPGYHVKAVPNGVHSATWTSPSFARLYDRYLRGWCNEPEALLRADCCLPDAEVWQAHLDAKAKLIQTAKQLCGVELDPQTAILGFARRMTAYKRPDLLFTDLPRLRAIARTQPFALVLAGKAHPHDTEGKRLIALLHAHMRELPDIPIVYLPNYDLALAQTLVAGCDVWLNTPLPPLEASGTSGMKAAHNGVPSLSVLDGWWVEGCIEGVTGWSVGDGRDGSTTDSDAASLCDKLEHTVLPLYYRDRPGFIRVMKGAIAKNASVFNSHRMLRRYTSDAYVR